MTIHLSARNIHCFGLSSIMVGQLVVEECKVMDSARAPLWIVFKNEETFAPLVRIIFKSKSSWISLPKR